MKFNSIDTEVAFGMTLEAGAYDQLMSDLKAKAGYTFNWEDAHGMETDPEEPIYFERRTYSLPILIKGNGKDDLVRNYSSFLTFLKNSKDILMETKLAPPLQYFKVRFSALSAFKRVNQFSENGFIVCRFTLTLTDDYPLGYQPVPGDFVVDTDRHFSPTVVAMRGDTFRLEIDLQDDSGNALNLTGMSYTINVMNISLALPNTLVLTATASYMAALPLGEMPLEVVQRDSQNTVKTIIQGALLIVEDFII